VAEDIEQRLAAAAAALREYEMTVRRGEDLESRIAEMSTELAALRDHQAGEQKDVERLEGLSLTRLLTALRGTRDDALARERAEADTARYRVAEVEARVDAVRREHAAVRARLSQLATVQSSYAAVLGEKERHLADSGSARGVRLLELADERGRLNGELHELSEALQAAQTAQAALSRVREKLGSASGWSTYDTFFGGGAISSAVKHSRLDEAAHAAAYADRCLAVLRTELADVQGVALSAPQVTVDGLTRFVDVWFDNIFTDLAVRDRIKKAQYNVANSLQLVSQVHGRLRQRDSQARARLAAIESERHDLLTTP
jgi:hypothetical protein